jgi:hypothetical protein
MNRPIPTVVPRACGWPAAWTLAVTMSAIVAALVIAQPSVATPTNIAAAATTAGATLAPAEVAGALPMARLLGSGALRYFGLAIYEARLWAAPDFVPGRYDAHTFALELRYARKLDGAAIAKRSITEMRRVGTFDPAQAKAWLDQLTQAFPDVKPGDRLTGVRGHDGMTRFYSNGQPTSSIADPEFGRLFFGIWLSDNTSEPALRRELIGQTW